MTYLSRTPSQLACDSLAEQLRIQRRNLSAFEKDKRNAENNIAFTKAEIATLEAGLNQYKPATI